jgi:peptide subunit release factor 1 (eRF1)
MRDAVARLTRAAALPAAVGARRHHVRAAAPEALQQGATPRPTDAPAKRLQRRPDGRAPPACAQVPPNGLVLYTGTILTDEGKEKKVNIDFEPFKTINTSLYLCDNKFHTEALSELLESENKYGFIVMDGNGSLFGTLSGNTREILHKFTVDLPKKHGRGGQSALRFARLRMEKRHNYVRKARASRSAARLPLADGAMAA